MPRIGLAYNQKPEPVPTLCEGDAPLSDEEPPSSAHALGARKLGAHASSDHEFADHEFADDGFADHEFAEWDSPATIQAVVGALATLGDVVLLEATESFPELLRAERPDIVFNIAEGLRGANRESHIPAICEFYGIPYSGSDPLTLSLCLDKARTKETLAYHGIATAPFALIHTPRAARDALRNLTPPLFVKPVHEGSSKGITERSLCRSLDEALATIGDLHERYQQPVLVEQYLPGAEFTCAVLGNGDGAAMLPIVGINFAALPSGALPIYGFEAKWLWDRPERPLQMFDCPARIGDQLARDIEEVVLHSYRVLGCRDWARVDVRLDAHGAPNVIEINPLPGILPDPADNSCLPKAARAAGIGYDELIQSCLLAAAERHGIADIFTSGRGRRGAPRALSA